MLHIEKLTPALCEDFLHYFDEVAFSDHAEWKGCYCLESHLGEAADGELEGDIPKRRALAKEFVLSGRMQGYLVYDGEEVVGWCCADTKENLRAVSEHEIFKTDEGKILSVWCYDIAPACRGKGIASLLLERVLADAALERYDSVEAYPFNDEKFPWQYHGTRAMYERFGFEEVRALDWATIVRKRLK